MGPETQPLVERAAELGAIEDVVRRAAGGSGSALVIEGAAGIGKTALMREARHLAMAGGLTAFSSRGGSLEAEFPYGIVRQLFGRAVGPDDPLLAGAASMAAPALGFESVANHAEEHALSYGLFWLVSDMGERAPLALIVDDLQWADAPSVRFLTFLVRRLADLPVALICGTRTTNVPLLLELCNESMVSVVRPSLLSRAGTAEFVRIRTSDAATRAFEDACHTATGGNPHLLRELLVSLEADELPPDDHTASSVPSMTPEGVSRSVLVRLGSLSADAVRLAHAVAVLGVGVELRHAAALADLVIARAAALAEDLVRISLLAPGRPLDVVHPLIGEVLRADMSEHEKRRLHRRAAELLRADGVDPQRIAAHLDMSDPAGERWAVDALREAAARARTEAALDIAQRWLTRALAEGVADERVRLQLELGEIRTLIGDAAGAVPVLREALEVGADPDDRADAALLLGRAYESLQQLDDAVDTFEVGLRQEEASEDRRSRLRSELSWSMAVTARVPETMTPDELAAFAQSGVEGPLAIEALGNLAVWHFVYGRRLETAECACAAAEDPALVADGLADHRVHSIVNMLTIVDEHERARDVLSHWFERARRRGSLLEYASANLAQAILEWRSGDVTACDAAARASLDSGVWRGDFAPRVWAFCALAHVERGELDEALSLADGVLDIGLCPGSEVPLYARARAYRAVHRFDAALADLHRLEELDGRFPASMTFPPWRLEMVECALARRDPDEAWRWMRSVREQAFDTPSILGATERLRAHLETGEERVRTLRTAAEILAGSVDRLEHARALIDLGVALRTTRDRNGAQEILREGADRAQRCGATALVWRAMGELKATGARPRRIRVTGVEALTGAERRVATLAARDPSNASVAQALFLTKSTVEKHLTSAYRKLGITSRAELGAALEDG